MMSSEPSPFTNAATTAANSPVLIDQYVEGDFSVTLAARNARNGFDQYSVAQLEDGSIIQGNSSYYGASFNYINSILGAGVIGENTFESPI